jgi:hypothetical protein
MTGEAQKEEYEKHIKRTLENKMREKLASHSLSGTIMLGIDFVLFCSCVNKRHATNDASFNSIFRN